MPGFFEPLENFNTKKKVHTVTIDGQSLVVTLEKKLEVMRNGENAYMWKSPTEIALKPPPKILAQHKSLKKKDRGYSFYDNDPYYPKEIIDGGFSWDRE